MIGAMRGMLSMLPPEVDDPLEADPAIFKPAMEKIEASLSLRSSWPLRSHCLTGHAAARFNAGQRFGAGESGLDGDRRRQQRQRHAAAQNRPCAEMGCRKQPG